MTVKPFGVGDMPPPRCWSSQPCSSEECVDNRLKATVEERDALRAQLATEREAHEKALAESEARYVAQTDEMLKVEREAHARLLERSTAVIRSWEFGGGRVDGALIEALRLAAAKVTPPRCSSCGGTPDVCRTRRCHGIDNGKVTP